MPKKISVSYGMHYESRLIQINKTKGINGLQHEYRGFQVSDLSIALKIKNKIK
jgi:hypothetical protein